MKASYWLHIFVQKLHYRVPVFDEHIPLSALWSFVFAEPHHVGADPDPTYDFDTDPDRTFYFDTNLNPAFHFIDADPAS